MNKVGYKRYLQSLGNQNHYIGYIPKLLELEQEFNINLDDYIPYNDDYSKADALYTVIPEEKLYDERLLFSINSYMRYRLSGFDEKGEAEISNKPNCSEYFTFNGTDIELKSMLSTFMSEKDSQHFIDNCQDFVAYLKEDEFIEETISFQNKKSETIQKTDSELMYLLHKSSNYNINITALTLMTISLLLDIKLTMGFASATLNITGFNGQAIARVNMREAEKCLILEAIHSKNRIISKDVFSICNSECVHNDLECRYQNEDKCIIKEEDITRILDALCEKNIFRKINDLYKYNF